MHKMVKNVLILLELLYFIKKNLILINKYISKLLCFFLQCMVQTFSMYIVNSPCNILQMIKHLFNGLKLAKSAMQSGIGQLRECLEHTKGPRSTKTKGFGVFQTFAMLSYYRLHSPNCQFQTRL